MTSGPGGDSSYTAGGSVLVNIAGPVHMIEVVYANGAGGSQVLWLTDVHYSTVVPAAGDDSLDGGAGDDTIYGGDGNDIVTGGSGNDKVYGDAGNDSLNGGIGNDTVWGGTGDDTLRGDAGTDTLYGEAGSDRFIVDDNDGTTTIVGGEDAGNTDYDTVQLDEAGTGAGVTVTFTGNEAGTFTFSGASSGTFTQIERIESTAFNDTINVTASNANQTIVANAGNDTVLGGGGNDLIYGGDGTDRLDGGGGNDVIYGDAGNDSITGGAGNDTLFGGAGSDTLSGDAGNDTLHGGTGSDRFVVDDNDGTTTITGGEDAGNTDTDTLALSEAGSGAGVTVTFTGNEAGTFTFSGASSGTFTEIESIQTTAFADTINMAASAVGQTVDAGAGNDTIIGGSGADLISGGAGDDTITVGKGDTVYGGDGNDTFKIGPAGPGGPGTITIVGGEGSETGGDTLDLNGQGVRSTLNITTPANVAGGMSGSITLLDGTVVNFSEIENIICFTPGALISTPQGLRAVETLRPGDLVVTRDHGLQPVRWAQSRTVRGDGRLAPVRIRANTFAGQERDLVVSPQHRMLYRGYRAELLFSESEVLVAATHMIDGDRVVLDPCDAVTYVHIMFDQHEVIFAEGAATESFHPGDMALNAISARAREELFEIFPTLRAMPTSYGATARRTLRGHEGSLLLAG